MQFSYDDHPKLSPVHLHTQYPTDCPCSCPLVGLCQNFSTIYNEESDIHILNFVKYSRIAFQIICLCLQFYLPLCLSSKLTFQIFAFSDQWVGVFHLINKSEYLFPTHFCQLGSCFCDSYVHLICQIEFLTCFQISGVFKCFLYFCFSIYHNLGTTVTFEHLKNATSGIEEQTFLFHIIFINLSSHIYLLEITCR